jgi:MFS family permease
MTKTDNYRYTRRFFTPDEIRRGLWVVTLAGSIGSVFYTQATVGTLVFTGFVMALGATNAIIGLLTTILPLARTAEIVSSYLMQRTRMRFEFFTWGLISSRLLWLPIILVPFYIGPEHPRLRLEVMASLCIISAILDVAGGNAWNSWMGDLIPGNMLGRYFGNRQIYTVGVPLVAGIVAGLFLDQYRGLPSEKQFQGYVEVVCVVLVFGIVDILLFRWVPHPPMKVVAEAHPFLNMIRVPLRDRNYRNLIILLSFWTFAICIAGPFWWVFVKGPEYVNMSYTSAFVLTAVVGVFQMAASPLWGKLADHWSAKKVMVVCTVLASLPCFVWPFVKADFTWPIYAGWIVSAIGFGGLFVVSVQLIIGMTPPQDRSTYLACQSAILGVVTTLSFLVGTGLVKLLQPVEIHLPDMSSVWRSLDAASGHFLFVVRSLFANPPRHPEIPLQPLPYVWRDLHLLFIMSGVLRILCLIPLARFKDVPPGYVAGSEEPEPAPSS